MGGRNKHEQLWINIASDVCVLMNHFLFSLLIFLGVSCFFVLVLLGFAWQFCCRTMFLDCLWSVMSIHLGTVDLLFVVAIYDESDFTNAWIGKIACYQCLRIGNAYIWATCFSCFFLFAKATMHE